MKQLSGSSVFVWIGRAIRVKGATIFCTGIVVTSAIAPVAEAGKVSIAGGLYSFTAENLSNKKSASIAGIGSYHMSYRYEMFQQVELDFGFSLVASDTFGGDLAFGFDVGANYYPFTDTALVTANSTSGTVVLSDRWRPFIGGSFNQRNFQSTSSQYAGFGVKVGSEFQYSEFICLHGSIRYLLLSGPNQTSATQIDLLGGLVFQF